jgi:hypothetical protein
MPSYVNGNPLALLLEKSGPELRYLALRDLLGPDPRVLDESYAVMRSSERIRALLVPGKNGILGDPVHFDILHRGSMWYFAEAAARGLDAREEAMARTARFLLDRCQMESGGISLNWKPLRAVACRTGDMVRWMIRAGVRDERMEKGIEWIIRNQRHDGGWLHCPLEGVMDMASLVLLRRSGGKGIERETDPETESCVRATASCLAALLERRRALGEKSGAEGVGRAVEFFLKRRFFMQEGRFEGPICCGRRDAEYQLFGYPVMSHYDALFGLKLAARAGYAGDPRAGAAFNRMIAVQGTNGAWKMESFGEGMLYAHKKNAPADADAFVTLSALEVLKYCGIDEWKSAMLV